MSADLGNRAFDLLEKLLDKLFDWKAILVLAGTFLLYVWLLPEADRSGVSLERLGSLLGSGTVWMPVAVGVCICLGAAIVGLLSYVLVLRQRVETQAASLAQLSGPRQSSRDKKALGEYGAKSKKVHDRSPRK